MNNLFARTFYIRIDEQRLRIDSPGVAVTFDEAAAIAIRDVSTKQARIEAIGNAAETYKGQSHVTVLYPFAHPRMVFGDFTVAEKLLAGAVRAFHNKQSWSFLRPIVGVIIHPLRKLEGGLSQIEVRALTELASNVGARRVAVHTGRELVPAEVEGYGAWNAQPSVPPDVPVAASRRQDRG